MLRAAGIEDLFEVRVDGIVAERGAPGGQAGPRHLSLAAAQAARRRAGAGGGLRGRPRRASSPDAPATSAAWSASTASASADALREHGADVVVDDLAELLEQSDRARRVRGRALVADASSSLDLDFLAQTESVFALSNGHIGLRGNLDEGEPLGLPGTYLNGFYEQRPLPYAEAAYGQPGVRPDGRQRDQRQGDPPAGRRRALRHPLRRAAVRTSARSTSAPATLHREAEWRSPAGQAVKVRSTRLVSFTQRAVAAIAYEVEPVDEPHARRRPVGAGRQRAAAGACTRTRARPRRSRRRSRPSGHAPRDDAAPCWSTARRPERPAGGRRRWIHAHRRARRRSEPTAEAEPDLARLTVTAELRARRAAAGRQVRRLRLVGQRTMPAVRDQVAAALAEARAHRLGPPARRAARATSTTSGTRADVELDGDAELQQAVRFALFHTLQAGARGRAAGDPGQGPDRAGLRRPHLLGHRVLRAPGAHLHRARRPPPTRCAGAIRPWTRRASARAQLGLEGAAFPWRTIHGEECSGYWPAGTAAFHINADIADAVDPLPARDRRRGVRARRPGSSCWSRPRGCGARSATTTRTGRFRIDGVTGPDEYSAIADNNVYTNLMAQRNLLGGGRRRRALPGRGAGAAASTPRRRPPGATPPRRC